MALDKTLTRRTRKAAIYCRLGKRPRVSRLALANGRDETFHHHAAAAQCDGGAGHVGHAFNHFTLMES